MIIFSVHDRIDFIEKNLIFLDKFSDEPVLLVDTNSETDIVKNYYESHKSNFRFKLDYLRIDEPCYENGAIINSLKYDSEVFYFLQDSVEIINENFIEEINVMLENNNVVAFASIPIWYTNDWDVNWIFSKLPCNTKTNLPVMPKGIFGSMFCIKKKTLELIPLEWLSYCKNKLQSCALERMYGIIFHLLKMNVIYVEGDYTSLLTNTKNTYINKTILNRQ